MQLNLESLKQRRENLCLKFAKSGIKNNKLRDLLPEKNKLEKPQTRNHEKYEVNFANTGRFKKFKHHIHAKSTEHLKQQNNVFFS